jgi:hypothetical protein
MNRTITHIILFILFQYVLNDNGFGVFYVPESKIKRKALSSEIKPKTNKRIDEKEKVEKDNDENSKNKIPRGFEEISPSDF